VGEKKETLPSGFGQYLAKKGGRDLQINSKRTMANLHDAMALPVSRAREKKRGKRGTDRSPSSKKKKEEEKHHPGHNPRLTIKRKKETNYVNHATADEEGEEIKWTCQVYDPKMGNSRRILSFAADRGKKKKKNAVT